ncbi:MAG: hypothetical protein C4297_08660 [Gemmataceae bacterium]
MLGVALGILVAGCASLNPKNWSLPRFGKKPPPERETGGAPEVTAPAVAAPSPSSGILAGQVIDAFGQRKPGAAIRVVGVDGADQGIEVTANEQGYFVIQGLQPGRRYKLIARYRHDGHMLAGTTLATPPNVVVVIRVTEELVTPDTPPVPAPPQNPSSGGNPSGIGYAPGAGAMGDPARSSEPAGAWPPPHGAAIGGNSAQPALTVPIAPGRGGAPASESPSPRLPPQWREDLQTIRDPTQARASQGVPAVIPGPSPFPGTAGTLGAPLANAAAQIGAAQVSAPAAKASSTHVETFALRDVQGRTFAYRPHGRLLLLYFWGTWSAPCVQGLPQLAEMHRRFRDLGLDIVGIAYEEGTFIEQSQRVSFVRQRQGATYPILLGGGEDCPLRRSLAVHTFPTLVLLDGQGAIVWRGEGSAPETWQALEREIRSRLGSP